MKRTYDTQEGYTPFLFYAIFGKEADIASVPQPPLIEELELVLDKGLALKQGALGNLLQKQDEATYHMVQQSDACIIVRGNIKEDGTLGYLETACAIVSQYVARGCAVLDLLSMQWYNQQEWLTLAQKDFDPYDHMQILLSQESGGVWLHTRGMMKFGRPDISIIDIPKPAIHEMKQLMDQIIYYEALGAMVLQPVKFHTSMGCYEIKPVFYNDFENFDFNNAFIEMKAQDIHKVAE